MSAPLIFLDTETTGLSRDDEVWDFFAIRRDGDGTEHTLQMFVDHDHAKASALPDEFLRDYHARFTPVSRAGQVVPEHIAGQQIVQFFGPDARGQVPHLIGAVPDFDSTRIYHHLLEPFVLAEPWHYHLIDVENLAVGYLRGRAVARTGETARTPSLFPPYDSEKLSYAVGVNPQEFPRRHTAESDARWAMAIWDSIMGPHT